MYRVFLVLLFLMPVGYAGVLEFPQQRDIQLDIYGPNQPGNKVFYFAPHQTEYVINDYLINQLPKRGGKFVVLRQSGLRYIFLRIDGRSLAVDPNRIFTPRGARSSIEKLNPKYLREPEVINKAVERANQLAVFIGEQLGGIKPGVVIIAIHNNTDGYDGDGKDGEGTVSIVRYSKKFGAEKANYIETLFTGKEDEDDLFFLTSPLDFRYFSERGFNVVLQHPQVATLESEDDGSLSVFCEMKGVRYINVEAQRDPDHKRAQKKMLKAVFELLNPDN